MEYTSSEVKVGGLIFAGFVALTIFLIAIVGANFGSSKVEYLTYLEYVGGISEGSLVKYGGMDVGTVSRIFLPEEGSGSQIGLMLRVNDNTPIKTDSKAYLTSIGLMSNPHIEISQGSESADVLPPGSLLASKEVLSFTRMAEPFGAMSAQLSELLDQIGTIMSEQNQERLSSILAGTDRIIAEGGDSVVNILDNLDALTANVETTTKMLNEALADTVGLRETLRQVQKNSEEIGGLITDIRSSLGDVQNMIVSNGTSIVEIMENFQFASRNLEEFSRLVKERPWLLVRKAAPPERKLP